MDTGRSVLTSAVTVSSVELIGMTYPIFIQPHSSARPA